MNVNSDHQYELYVMCGYMISETGFLSTKAAFSMSFSEKEGHRFVLGD